MKCDCGMDVMVGDEICPRCGELLEGKWSASPAGSKPNELERAIAELDQHDQLTLREKIRDCQHPRWERLLRDLVKVLTDPTVRF